VTHSRVYAEFRVCEYCGHHFLQPARERIMVLTDPGSFREWDAELEPTDPLHFTGSEKYRSQLKRVQKKTGLRDAVVTGEAQIGGYPLALAVFDFHFLGGSMGSVVGEKIARLFERAAERRLPVFVITSTGGARIQEGMLALLQMAKTAAAAGRFQQQKLPFVVLFAHPTTGGVFASFANLADVALAEPKALIGFAGPRVVEGMTGKPLPPDSHKAEFQLEHGMVDAVVDRRELRETLRRLLAHAYHREPSHSPPPAKPKRRRKRKLSTWEVVQVCRHPRRPGAGFYVEHLFDDFVPLRGDRSGGDDPAVIGGMASIGGRSVVVIGQDRTPGKYIDPAGYRKSCRLMRLAERWSLPIVTFVDTKGANPTYEAESGGIAHTLAVCLRTMSEVAVPTVAVVIGEGGSGGALALAVADRVLMQEFAIYSVISPEGAASIVFRNPKMAKEIAGDLQITAHELLRLGVIDQVIPEPDDGAHTNPVEAAERVGEAIIRSLDEIATTSPEELVEKRYERYRAIGKYK
jgi:acetyl-CoA carboxylase carboxyl transferase beta subunit/acetyl-CoA carboxylase carboxyl transferase alpha subunit